MRSIEYLHCSSSASRSPGKKRDFNGKEEMIEGLGERLLPDDTGNCVFDMTLV